MDQIDFSDLNLEEINWDGPDFEEISNFDLINGSTRALKEVKVETFLQENQNQNSKKKTQSDMKVFLEFLLFRNEARYQEFVTPRHAEHVYM